MIASQAAFYEEEVLQAQLEAIRALREIMVDAAKPLPPPEPGTTPAAHRAKHALETRRLSMRLKAATAILKIRPVWQPNAKPAVSPVEASTKLAALVATAVAAHRRRAIDKALSPEANESSLDAQQPPSESPASQGTPKSP